MAQSSKESPRFIGGLVGFFLGIGVCIAGSAIVINAHNEALKEFGDSPYTQERSSFVWLCLTVRNVHDID